MASLFIKSTKSRILSLNFSFFLSLESSIFRAFLLSCRKTNHVERKILMFWDNVAGVYDLFADIFRIIFYYICISHTFHTHIRS
jgi:hypothetical protein